MILLILIHRKYNDMNVYIRHNSKQDDEKYV